MNKAKKKIQCSDLGKIPYDNAWKLQEDLRAKRVAKEICDQMLLVEHPPVITLGRRLCQDDILSSESTLKTSGIEIVKTNRGGRATYHGPGQLVCYFICDIRSFGMGVSDFVNAMEEICIRALLQFEIKGLRDANHPGIWVDNNKIAAIGLNISRGITQHGFALNVDCDLSAYRHIIACGIKGRGVTSIGKQLIVSPKMDEVKNCVITHSANVFGREIVSHIT